jgi:AcrR family transcriptional regulator
MNDAGVRPRVDGRTLRAERTRRAITDAHFALIEEGELRPTAERIAERAGVSLRALWTNFKDMEGLFAAAGERLMERQRAEFRPVPPELPRAERIERYCAQRARLLELIAPAARAARIREPFSAQLRKNRVPRGRPRGAADPLRAGARRPRLRRRGGARCADRRRDVRRLVDVPRRPAAGCARRHSGPAPRGECTATARSPGISLA